MFTGLVQGVGEVKWRGTSKLLISVPESLADSDWEIGESISVSGVCLTLVGSESGLQFDLSEETLMCSNLGQLGTGSKVNLERAMRVGDRFGGHIVQGHVDGTGRMVEVSEVDDTWTFRFDLGEEAAPYLIDKGSICIEGISLTVIRPEAGAFDVAVIPHTYRETNLGDLRPGAMVNVEYDVLAKYVAKTLSLR